MSGLCGWFGGRHAEPEAEALIAGMSERLPRSAGAVTLRHATSSFAVAVVGTGTNVALHADGSSVAAVVGSPRWSGEYHDMAVRQGHARTLAAAFARHERELLDFLSGHFAIFAAHSDRRIALAAIDRSGVHRLCYGASGREPFVFGTTTGAVRGHPSMRGELSPQSLYDFLYFNKLPAPTTIFADQRKLMAGECVWHENGRSATQRYWHMGFRPARREEAEALEKELPQVVQRAVARASDGLDAARLGAFLSGGLDSSTVTGMLARVSGAAPQAFTIGFEEPRYDERHYARIAARRFGAKLVEHVMMPAELIEIIPRMAVAYDEPYANSSAILAYSCAAVARDHGISVMLAGDGGDELFGGNARYAYQKYFEFYGSVPGWFRRFLLEPAVTASVSGGLPLVRKARSYIAKASTRLPDRLQCDNFFGSTSPSRLMSDHFLGSIDPRHPLETMRLSYDPVETDSWLQRMLAFDLQFTLADDDLRKVVTMCELAGIDVRFPLLDDEIVALASRVPPELCVKGFKLRYFYKNAFRGFLPDEILSKPKHGFGMPFETWFANSPALRELINDNVARLKRRDLLNAKFLDDVMSGSDAEIEAYSHDIHWALLLLELWLERHVDHAASVKT